MQGNLQSGPKCLGVTFGSPHAGHSQRGSGESNWISLPALSQHQNCIGHCLAKNSIICRLTWNRSRSDTQTCAGVPAGLVDYAPLLGTEPEYVRCRADGFTGLL